MCSKVEQVFIQSMMSKGALKEKEACDLYLKAADVCGDESASEEHFSQYVLSMNKHLKPLGLEVGGARMEDCDEVWYAIVNRLPDAAAKVGSKFSPQELELFNKLVKLLVLEEGVVSSSKLLNSTSQMERKLTAEAAQEFLKTLVKEHWLTESDGKVRAGPRFILELRPFLSEIYGENIQLCKMCNEPVIQGQQCECGVKAHLLCVTKLAGGRNEIRCPNCRETWSHAIPDIDLPMTSVPLITGARENESRCGYDGTPPTKRAKTTTRK